MFKGMTASEPGIIYSPYKKPSIFRRFIKWIKGKFRKCIPVELFNMTVYEPKYLETHSVKIGNQIWMSENLCVNDGGNGIHWNKANGEWYYTWKAAKRIADKIPGWHLPSREEWDDLVKATGYDAANLRDKSWKGTNTYGFSTVPAGNWNNGFHNVGVYASFWTSESDGNYAWNRFISTGSIVFEYSFLQYSGLSVRLVKDK